jgi:hypothetical protein
MTKLGWRGKALYIVIALALVVGLFGGSLATVFAQGSVTFDSVSPDKGVTDGGMLTLANVTFTITGLPTAVTVQFDTNGDDDFIDPTDVSAGVAGDGTYQMNNMTVYGSRMILELGIQVLDVTPAVLASDTIEIGLDPWLAPTPRSPYNPLLRDVKGANQKFVVLNLPYGPSEQDLVADLNAYYASGCDVPLNREWVGEQVIRDLYLGASATYQIFNDEIVSWTLTPGLTVPGGDDAIVVDGGGPTYGNNSAQNWIEIDKHLQGEAYVSCWLDEDLDIDSDQDGDPTNDQDIELYAEKKWGEVYSTLLDLNAATPAWDPVTETLIPAGVDGTCTEAELAPAGDAIEPYQEQIADWVWAQFLQGGGGVFEARAAHAKVNWWVILDDAAGDNLAFIQDIQNALQGEEVDDCEGCGRYAEWDFGDLVPKTMIDDLAFDMYIDVVSPADIAGPQHAVLTEFKDPMTGAIDPVTPLRYVVTHTEDSMPGETRGLATAWLSNEGDEDVLIVTLVEYDEEYAGENPVCVEVGKKRFIEEEVPPPAIVKTPQLRWAGEKIVLEQNWADYAGPLRDKQLVAIYHLEEQSVGELSIANMESGYEFTEGDIWVDLGTWPMCPFPSCDFGYTSEVLLESEVQGEADVNVKLYEYDPEFFTLVGPPLVNYGFLVYFMALEDVTLAEDITPPSSLQELTPDSPPVTMGDDAEVAVRVRGWFTSDELPGTTREAIVSSDGVTISHPAGRYVMPDDWPALANFNYDFRPNFDLMDKPGGLVDIVEDDDADLIQGDGPFNTDVVTTSPPDMAADPSVGPFNTLQQWSTEQVWITDAQVPCSWLTQPLRNTVVPDGVLTTDDAPMPQALVIFNITRNTEITELLTQDKDDLSGYGVLANGDLPSPFYFVEIPSHTLIPAGDYDYNSWGANAPYEYWVDLLVRNRFQGVLDSEPGIVNPLDLETYTDNHGIAACSVDALGRDGEVDIRATVDYPAGLKKGKYGPITSEDITITWGALDLNPHFLADRLVAEVEDIITFTNLTEGGALPYKKAEWDFNSDGTIDVTYELGVTPEDPMDPVPWSYVGWGPGVYSVKLWMTDDADTVRFEERPFYITVGDAVPEVVFPMPYGLDADPAAINLYQYDEDAVQVDMADPDVEASIPAEVNIIWHYAGTVDGWEWFRPGWAESTLTTMDPGLYYVGIATTDTEWPIPQE